MAFDPVSTAILGICTAGICVVTVILIRRRARIAASAAAHSAADVPTSERGEVDSPGRLDGPVDEEDFESDSSSSGLREERVIEFRDDE